MSELTIRTSDGLNLAALTEQPSSPTRAVVAMVHGAGEHMGRYAELRRALVAGGFAVAAADLRGFGGSPGGRGHITSWADYHADLAAIVALARSLAPDRPMFLFGHGLGGLLSLDYAACAPAGLAGVIASSPLLRPAGVRRPVHELGVRLLSYLVPRRRLPLAGTLSSAPRCRRWSLPIKRTGGSSARCRCAGAPRC